MMQAFHCTAAVFWYAEGLVHRLSYPFIALSAAQICKVWTVLYSTGSCFPIGACLARQWYSALPAETCLVQT